MNAVAQQLNHPDPAQRLNALKALCAAEPLPSPGGFINNHIHTCYSFSPYSPAAAVYAARTAGLATAGIMDHDSVGGCEEFLRAGAIANLPVTAGFELRVRMDSTSLRGRRFNTPDQCSIAYVAAHGIPRRAYGACDAFLAPLRQRRSERSRQMTDRLNRLLAGHGIALDFRRDILPLSCHSGGGSITERHILCGLSQRILAQQGSGEALIRFLQQQLTLPLDDAAQARLREQANPHLLYDLIGILKSRLLPRFYIEAADECPDVREFIRFVNRIGAIAAYAYLGDVTASVTGDKAPQRFEDGYLEELFEVLNSCGFHAVTYMPARNSPQQLRRVMALCRRHGLFQISGEDINTSRQSFLCPALAQPEFAHLGLAAWALIGHEIAAQERAEGGMFSPESLRCQPDLQQRAEQFAALAKQHHGRGK